MPHQFQTTDISGQFVLLGTGTSVGVPTIGCGCPVCTSDDPRNKRTRTAAIVGLPEGNLLIDTPPDLRSQLLREKIGIVHAVMYTHDHADHIFGLDDLRLFPFHLGRPVPLYCEPLVQRRIERSFDYAFDRGPQTHAGAIPSLQFFPIGLQPIDVLGTTIRPLRLLHGPKFEVLGFRIGNIAFCTDTNFIPEESFHILQGVEYLILDALRHSPHPTHFNVEQAVEVAKRLQPKQTYLTHVCHDLDHASTCKSLPEGIDLAYDGLRIPLKLELPS